MQKTILLIEDEQNLRDILKKKLIDGGYIVLEAKDGEEGIKSYIENKPDLVMTDIIMPKKTGFDLIEEIRIKYKSNVPIFVISNLDQPNDREMGKNLGVNMYFVKSDISLKNLLIEVNKALLA